MMGIRPWSPMRQTADAPERKGDLQLSEAAAFEKAQDMIQEPDSKGLARTLSDLPERGATSYRTAQRGRIALTQQMRTLHVRYTPSDFSRAELLKKSREIDVLAKLDKENGINTLVANLLATATSLTQEQVDNAIENLLTIGECLVALREEPTARERAIPILTSIITRASQVRHAGAKTLLLSGLRLSRAQLVSFISEDKGDLIGLEHAQQEYADIVLQLSDPDRVRDLPVMDAVNDPRFYDLVKDLAKAITDIAQGEGITLPSLIQALTALKRDPVNPDAPWTTRQLLAERVSERVGQFAMAAMKQGVPVPAGPRNEIPRVASDVLVHLMVLLRQPAVGLEQSVLQLLDQLGKALFLSHRVYQVDVDRLIGEALKHLPAGSKANEEVEVLRAQLHLGPVGGHMTQQHDGFCRRAFDTLAVQAMVQHPSQAQLTTSWMVSTAFADMLDPWGSDNVRAELGRLALRSLHQSMRIPGSADHVRPWSGDIPDLEPVFSASKSDPFSSRGAGNFARTLLTFLRNEPSNGTYVVAAHWLMAKLSTEVIYAANDRRIPMPEWLNQSTVLSSNINNTQRLRQQAWSGKRLLETPGVGITLAHQPTAARALHNLLAERPTVTIRPGRNEDHKSGRGLVKLPQAMGQAYAGGASFGNGLGGSVSLLLHGFDHLRRTTPGSEGWSPRVALLNQLTFLVHDGGHTLNEVLAVAKLVDERLNLDFGLSKSNPSSKFVVDLTSFVEALPDSTQINARSAISSAWHSVQNHFATHSRFLPTQKALLDDKVL